MYVILRSVFCHLDKKRYRTMYESSIARHFAERGRREGREEGRKEGREEGRMLSVLDLVSARFGSSNAEQLKLTLESIEDTALLQHILIKASRVNTFDELQQELATLIS